MASIQGFTLALPEDVPERPHHPDAGYKFPTRSFGKKTIINCSFQPSWFLKWPFLHYSKPNDVVYCHTCLRMFKEKKRSLLPKRIRPLCKCIQLVLIAVYYKSCLQYCRSYIQSRDSANSQTTRTNHAHLPLALQIPAKRQQFVYSSETTAGCQFYRNRYWNTLVIMVSFTSQLPFSILFLSACLAVVFSPQNNTGDAKYDGRVYFFVTYSIIYIYTFIAQFVFHFTTALVHLGTYSITACVILVVIMIAICIQKITNKVH